MRLYLHIVSELFIVGIIIISLSDDLIRYSVLFLFLLFFKKLHSYIPHVFSLPGVVVVVVVCLSQLPLL